ncbi:diguanylate cyclase [Gemmatirosa kalamazoonensis]|uniref:Diguanylate cyclase n=1 Tax=Gemmatirosa kalamazoonensis TaxID=861299 RepID=W0RG42_9BACT|nr:response regulator [Gemmatirosa kalamazoonensis]AHG90079.1 diguanylate cyclase [Gemmatirosa kalamazoonensis]
MSFLLYADDHEHMRLMVRDVLQASGHEVALAVDGASALACVREREPDLLILDVSMPGLSGYEVCRVVKSNPFTARVPVLMLTGEADVDAKVTGFEAGADDYLTKPFDPRELRARVGALLRIVQREGERNPTSGLPGGRAIEEAITRRIDADQAFAVGYLDIDHFKPFNDVFGFAAADAVIRATGEALRDVVRDAGGAGDFVGHIGGDDFLLVTEADRGEAMARLCVRRFRALVRRIVGPDVAARGSFTAADRDGAERTFRLSSLSAAVLVVAPARYESAVALGERAAELKRRAKHAGGDTVLVDTL